jgi:hypothetical protein
MENKSDSASQKRLVYNRIIAVGSRRARLERGVLKLELAREKQRRYLRSIASQPYPQRALPPHSQPDA